MSEPVTDYYIRCPYCTHRKRLALFASRPWAFQCRGCKAIVQSDNSAAGKAAHLEALIKAAEAQAPVVD